MKKFIKHLDRFQIFFDFRIGENLTYKTFIGGFIYIIYLSLMIFYFIFNFIDHISESEFNIRYYSEQKETKVPINEDFFYSVLIETGKNRVNITNHFIIEQKVVERVDSRLYINRTRGFPCSKNSNSDQYLNKSYFIENRSLSDFYCFIRPEFNLTGDYNSRIFKFIDIDIRFNLTMNNTIAIDIEDFKFNFIFMDKNIDFKKGKFENSTRSVYSTYLKSYFEYFNIYFAPLEIKVDSDYFIKKYQTNSTYKYSKLERGILMNRERNNTKNNLNFTSIETGVSRFYLRVDSEIEHIDIYYEKIPQLLSNLFALNKSVFFILNLILYEWNYFKAKQYIFSRVFKYKDLFFKKYKEIYSFEKPLKDRSNFKKNSVKEDKLGDANIKKSNGKKEMIYLDNHRKNVHKKNMYYKDNEIINRSSKRKFDIEISLNDISAIRNNVHFNNVKNKLNSKSNEEINKSLFVKSSIHLMKKIQENSVIFKNENINKINKLQKNQFFIKQEEEKIKRIKDLSVYFPEKLSNDSKQILDEFTKNTSQKKSSGFDEFNEKNFNSMKIRGYDLILRYCLCKKKNFQRKLESFNMAEKNFHFFLDITTYMIKMNEFEILKTVLLQDDLKVLMEFISKPIIISEFAEDSKNSFENNISNYLAGRNFINHFTQINKATFDNIYISYKNMKQNFIEMKNDIKLDGLGFQKNIENLFEKQMEFLFNDC